MSNCVIKTIDRQKACLSFAWVAWIILMGWLLFSGCVPSTSSPTTPQAEEPATPAPPPPPGPDLFNITLIGMDDLTYRGAAMHKDAIRRAKIHWENVITEGLPDVTMPQRYLQSLPASWGTYRGDLDVDDIAVRVTYGGEGAGGAIATAVGWVVPSLRNNPPLPILGLMTVYAPLLEVGDRTELEMVFTHELGHALGFSEVSLRDRAGIETIGGLPYFRGRAAALAYQFVLNRVGQQPARAGNFVPMEADGYFGHWKHPELQWDVMGASFISGKVLSRVTIAAMGDIGYKVDMRQAEEPHIPPATKLAVPPRFVCGGGHIYIITP